MCVEGSGPNTEGERRYFPSFGVRFSCYSTYWGSVLFLRARFSATHVKMSCLGFCNSCFVCNCFWDLWGGAGGWSTDPVCKGDSGVCENTIRLCLPQNNNNKGITQTWLEVCSSHMEGIILFPVHGLRLAPQRPGPRPTAVAAHSYQGFFWYSQRGARRPTRNSTATFFHKVSFFAPFLKYFAAVTFRFKGTVHPKKTIYSAVAWHNFAFWFCIRSF